MFSNSLGVIIFV